MPDPAQSLLQSLIFHWDETPEQSTSTGSTRKFFKAPTSTLDQLSVHVTTLNLGESAHPPHQHPEEEMIIVKEGVLEALHNGQKVQMSAGSILFIAPNDLHGVRNAGTTPASYLVVKWWPPGMLKNA